MNRSPDYYQIAGFIWYFLVITGMFLLYLLAFAIHPSENADFTTIFSSLQYFSYNILEFVQSQIVLQVIWYLAVAAHAIEAGVACAIAQKIGYSFFCVGFWSLQTLILGYPSLRILLAKRNTLKKMKSF